MLKRLVKGIGLDFNKGTENTYSDYASSDYIQVDFNINPNYYLSGLLNTLNSCVFAYNKDKVFLGRTSGQGRLYISLNKNIFTSGTAQGTGDIAYLRVSQYVNINLTGTIDDIDNAKIQLEIGTTKTDYEPYGYRIPVKVSNGIEDITTNIYLNEPLTINDYIHYKNQELSKNGVITNIELPNIPTLKGTTILSVDTNIQPSNVEVVYKGK